MWALFSDTKKSEEEGLETDVKTQAHTGGMRWPLGQIVEVHSSEWHTVDSDPVGRQQVGVARDLWRDFLGGSSVQNGVQLWSTHRQGG